MSSEKTELIFWKKDPTKNKNTKKTKSTPLSPAVKVARKPINVGGVGDCGFKAVAAAIIANILNNQSAANEKVAHKLLQFYTQYITKEQPILSPLKTARQQL